jgi:hypothetical protein
MELTTETEIKKTKTSKGSKKNKIPKEEIITEEQITNEDLQESTNEVVIEENIESGNLDLELEADSESESEKNTSDIDNILYSNEEFIQKLDILIDAFDFINKNSLKNYDINKEFINIISKKMIKIDKLHTVFRTTSQDIFSKELLSSIKSNGQKKKNPKKTVDKDKCAINLVYPSFKEVLKFLNLPDGTEISRRNLIQGINAFVKKEKTENNPDIYVEGDNRSFRLIGELKVLFEFARKQMILRGDSDEDTPLPEKIGYTGIMKYLKYFLKEVEKK